MVSAPLFPLVALGHYEQYGNKWAGLLYDNIGLFALVRQLVRQIAGILKACIHIWLFY